MAWQNPRSNLELSSRRPRLGMHTGDSGVRKKIATRAPTADASDRWDRVRNRYPQGWGSSASSMARRVKPARMPAPLINDCNVWRQNLALAVLI